MEGPERDEDEVAWPGPSAEPEEEPFEPWARLRERALRWEGWDDFMEEFRRSNADP